MKKVMQSILAVAVSLTIITAWTASAMAVNVPRMSKEALKAKLDDQDVVILDVRLGKDWKASEFKIKGAVRADPRNVDSWAMQYPMDKTLVLYCA